MSSDTASPPNRLTTPSSSRAGLSGIGAPYRAARPPLSWRRLADHVARHDPLRAQHHHHNNGDTEDEIAPRAAHPEQLGQEREEQASCERTPGGLRAADQHEKQDVDRQQRIEILRFDEAVI